ncbi:chloride channel protein [Paramaledivibacter caminithermalis]|jgi:CIC family chloride channel protein|nr:chloride channel protein [Paramaledivibacter caminithermalis]
MKEKEDGEMYNYFSKLNKIIGDERRYENLVMMLLALFIGIITGATAIAFNKLVDIFRYIFFESSFLKFNTFVKLRLFFTPIIGGSIIGIINKLFLDKKDEGFGVARVFQELKHINKFLMKPRLVFIKITQTIITLGSGLSAGRQGPIIHLGGAIGSVIGYKFNFTKRKLRILIGCGVAGSIAGVFNAPIAASLFVLEILMNKECLEYFAPIVISSITSVIITRILIGDTAFLEIKGHFGLVNYKELIFYIILGILLGIVGVFYMKSIDYVKENIRKIKVSSVFYPIIGAFGVAIIGYFLPQIFDIEYGTINKIVEGNFGLRLLILLFLGKIFATALTIGSGGVGGVFVPGIYIGAAFGGIFGIILNNLIPFAIFNINTYSLVGMGTMFSAFANAPITATIILLELTDNYTIILPILLSCAVSSVTTQLIAQRTIYNVTIEDIYDKEA